MKLKELMTRDVTAIPEDATLKQAAHMMQREDTGMLPVMQDGRSLVGVITDRDIALRGVANGLDPSQTLVGDVMSREVACCREDQSVDECAQVMKKHRVRRLVVLDGGDQPIGIVSLTDVAQKTSDSEMLSDTYRTVTTPA